LLLSIINYICWSLYHLWRGFLKLCVLKLCWLYLSFNISIIFRVFVICLQHVVVSLFWGCILDEVSSEVQHVLHVWFTLNCIYKLHCTSIYSCMTVEFYACQIWSFQDCDYLEHCLVGCDAGTYLLIFFGGTCCVHLHGGRRKMQKCQICSVVVIADTMEIFMQTN